MYEIVFVLAGPDKDRSPESNRAGAARILLQQKLTNQVIAVGGIEHYIGTPYAIKRAERLAKLIGDNIPFLVSKSNTWGNFETIGEYIVEHNISSNAKLGFLTNFWHLPRATRMMLEQGLRLFPISAESVLMFDRSPETVPLMKDFHSLDWAIYITREIEGLSAIESGTYSGINFPK